MAVEVVVVVVLCWWCGGVVVEVVVWWWRWWWRCGGGDGDVVEVQGGAVSSLYSQCILTVSSLYPSKERCLWSSAAAALLLLLLFLLLLLLFRLKAPLSGGYGEDTVQIQ